MFFMFYLRLMTFQQGALRSQVTRSVLASSVSEALAS